MPHEGRLLAACFTSVQLSLFDPARAPAEQSGPGAIDSTFGGLERLWLDERSWVDHLPGWVRGSDALFEAVLDARKWNQRSRHMYERRVLEPRLTSPWNLASGKPLEPALIEQMRQVLSGRYGVVFDSVGFNLYRNGADSVAWHADRISRAVAEPTVALVSLGEPRRFLLRPKGGGTSRKFLLGRGDLLVTGGLTQRTWEHAVPRVAQAGPRISLAFRYGMSSAAYGRVED